ncbi:MAG: N-acetylmuramoyl-L-alanine amidase [Hydrococcus sp. RU_2_2]|nr:N-acetylmuramoyl-L-alanine amidase [Hydrococcus sp. RU_2_2]NJP17825.1 N-acetylmuramoyl-L-alanine amidase [Hydrococcus sp. CRU_1_1]
MKTIWGAIAFTSIMLGRINLDMSVAASEKPLYLAYPPNNHQTTSDKIFFIGSASASGEVLINGQPIQRSQAGYFAPSFPLKMGNNIFTLRHENQEIKLKVTRIANTPTIPIGVAFAKDSLAPSLDIARMPNESICFSAIAPANATVSVRLGDRIIPLFPQSQTVQLPPNSAVLTSTNQPTISREGNYQGCSTFSTIGNLGNPIFQLSFNGQTISQQGTGKIEILPSDGLQVIEVIAQSGVARTGPSTDRSRLTPLPKGTIASVTATEGEWLRLDYGGWIKREETRSLPHNIPPKSLIRGVNYQQVGGATEITFPLQVPVPIRIQQGEKRLVLTLYNTTAQTDTIRLDDDPIIKRLDWQQIAPGQVEYTFNLKSEQQWGYDVKYQGTNLILTLRHPPQQLKQNSTPLQGIKILLDPGHGGTETGARGPNGYTEKEVNLVVSKLLEKELIKRGATVYLTREDDREISLVERVDTINKIKPTVALSIHYNALPDWGDAINTKGVGMFWYHAQAHSLAIFLHNYLVAKLNRPSYGVFWNNLALTRPHITPSVLLELGFMINPDEFEWIENRQEQAKLAQILADGIVEWFATVN